MTNLAFDTLTASKDLQQAGFEAPQAEAIALVIKDGQGDLATKADIDLVKADIEMVRTELSAKIDKVESELSAKIDKVDAKIDRVETDLSAKIDKVADGIIWLKWSIAVVVAVMLSMFGVMFAMLS